MDEREPTRRDVRECADGFDMSLVDSRIDILLSQFRDEADLVSALPEPELTTGGDTRGWRRSDDETDPLGAFLTRCEVAGSADGPLGDVCVGVKDNIAVAGVPLTCGSPMLEEFVPRDDATVVSRLLDVGATIVGKTNMDEFAYGGSTSTMRFRLARNPHDPERMPGFTSSGSAVAVANGDVDVALGTDTGGSVRFPAAWCGVVGVKPTRGLVSHYGYVQFAKTIDNIGPIARTVEDAARVLEVIAGADSRDERTRGAESDEYVAATNEGRDVSPSSLTIGVPEQAFAHDSEVVSRVQDALDALEAAGADVRTVRLSDFELALPAWLTISVVELRAYIRSNGTNVWLLSQSDESQVRAMRRISSRLDQLSDPLVRSLLLGEWTQRTHGGVPYALAQRAREAVTSGVDEALADVDVLATPTVSTSPPPWDDGIEDLSTVVTYMAPFNLTGHPAISVPCGEVDGLPVGLQFVAKRFDEPELFRAAAAWESLRTDS
ncbi:MAG: amidase [Haloglomus sp.]